MAVNATHPHYDAHVPAWEKCRDVIAGQEKVHAAGTKYLPKLDGQDVDGITGQYDAYRARATFYNATGRTLEGLTGLVFRKPPVVSLPTGMDEWRKDVTLTGLSLEGFAQTVVDEVVSVNRAGILVDYPRADPTVVTRKQQEVKGMKPFLKLYTAEQIIDWRIGQVNNKTGLTQVRMTETVWEQDTDDEFEVVAVEQVRQLMLVPRNDGSGWIYVVQLWRKDEKGNWIRYGEPMIPTMGGMVMRMIPFVFVNDQDTTWAVRKPVLLDLVNVNLSHYRTTADLEHGAHYCGLPTPYIFGVEPEHAPNAIGPNQIWKSSVHETKAGFVEFTGQGLEALEKRLEKKEQEMASLGARMLAPEKRQAESGEALMIRNSGEHSVLASIANSASDAMRKALEIARDWLRISGEVGFALNTDFVPIPMSPEMLKQLTLAVQGGKISFETYFENLQQGEVIRPDKSADEELAEIQTGEMDMPPKTEPAKMGLIPG